MHLYCELWEYCGVQKGMAKTLFYLTLLRLWMFIQINNYLGAFSMVTGTLSQCLCIRCLTETCTYLWKEVSSLQRDHTATTPDSIQANLLHLWAIKQRLWIVSRQCWFSRNHSQAGWLIVIEVSVILIESVVPGPTSYVLVSRNAFQLQQQLTLVLIKVLRE